ncbi:MAG: enoyl-CoA hydratase/isomerase family protein [Epsilonproteobacteria bacterium]|nr:MAG: enoyl-CoA hydratase/isomerase family protein [Campylobacterota bacterium]RLA65984.1 MAG: enoyl-CoA hydratase/isomerase family protein [Campylobacterota bacterium]
MEKSVYFSVENSIGHIWLNSPKTLNALSIEMIISMTEQLETWEDDLEVRAVIMLSTSERAFCAGGDVVSLYKAMVEDKNAGEFFKYEYFLDQYIHNFKKPIISLADGIVMGGGIGIMNGASHRIVTERSMLAMPEITIGLFPDVGGSYFLNKMPGNVGKFLALTGARLNGADAKLVKMADYFISSDQVPVLKEALGNLNWQEDTLEDLLKGLEAKSSTQDSEVEKRLDEINKLAAPADILEITKNWAEYTTDDKWLKRALGNYQKGSPTSAAVILEQIKRGKELSLEKVFAMELNMAKQFTLHHDFREGVRALLIDKDNNPQWKPASIADVSNELVSEHFKEN